MFYVIGDDKGFEHGYSAGEVDNFISGVSSILNENVFRLDNRITTLENSSTNAQKKITSGTAAPSGGSNGDIYIQY